MEPGVVEVLGERYEVGGVLGRGVETGRTLLARDLELGRDVVVKELRLADAADWKAVELFERGAGVLRSLVHRQIPAFYDMFQDEEGTRFYVVQERVEGRNLYEMLEHEGRLGEEEIRAFLERMLDVLEYLHGLSPPVLHRDIKPSNIMQQSDGAYVLIDFDTVQRVMTREVGGSTVVGTSGYMAPEQLMGRAVPASDLYGLGATAVHLATGVHPMELPMVRMQLAFREVSGLSDGLSRVLEGMLKPDVEARFQNVGEVRTALLMVEAGGGKWVSDVVPRPVHQVVRDVVPQTADEALQAIVAQPPFGKVQRLSRIEIKNDTLVIVVLSKFTYSLVMLWVLVFLMNGVSLWCFLGMSGGHVPASFYVGCIALVSVFLSWWAASSYLGNFLETGVEQRLTVSREGVRLEEKAKFRVYWRTKRRKLVRWFIPAEDLQKVFVRLWSNVELQAASERAGRLLHHSELDPGGLVLVDRHGTEYMFGQLLGMEHKYSYGQKEELKWIVKSIQAYLN